MFFKNYLIYIFLKFLLIGLYFGIVRVFCRFVNKLSKNNVYVYNLISFVFWLAFGAVFAFFSTKLYNYTFCWFGLLGMFLGLLLVQISIEILFTNLILLLYNKIVLKVKGKKYGKLHSGEEN